MDMNSMRDIKRTLNEMKHKPKITHLVMNTLISKNNEELEEINIRDRIQTIMDATKVITKKGLPQHAKSKVIKFFRDVVSLKSLFKCALNLGLHSPWNGKGDLYPENYYVELMATCKNNDINLKTWMDSSRARSLWKN